jgi:hypothetical protein
MRIFIIAIAIAILGPCATTARAADDGSPLVVTLPESADHYLTYLFMFKKNNVPISMSPQQFCTKMDFGEAAFGIQPDEIKDNKIVAGNLDWVICRFKHK